MVAADFLLQTPYEKRIMDFYVGKLVVSFVAAYFPIIKVSFSLKRMPGLFSGDYFHL